MVISMPSRADSARVAAFTATLMALASVLGYAEAVLLPPLPVAGMRLGIANVAVVVALAAIGPRAALSVALGRVFLVGLATGSLAGPASWMGLAGALAAFAVMAALHHAPLAFSPLGWSVAGSAAHVCAQLAVACVLVGSPAPLALAPLALPLSLAAGLTTGALALAVLSRSPISLSRPLAPVSSVGTGEVSGLAAASIDRV